MLIAQLIENPLRGRGVLPSSCGRCVVVAMGDFVGWRVELIFGLIFTTDLVALPMY